VCRPSRPAYGDIATLAGGTVLAVRGEPAADFAIDPERVARRITPDTRVLVLGSPLVPAGVVHDEDTLRRLTELAVEHNLAVITDEEFEPFIFDGSPHVSIGSLPGMAERTITIGGFSFAYAMRGWRVGYMAGPQQIMASMMKLKQALSICSAAVSQFAALAAITGPRAPVEEAYSLLAGRRTAAFAALDGAGITYARSAAGPYLLIRGSGPAQSDRALVKRLAREAGVLLTPGSTFGVPSWLRLSLTQPDERIVEAFDRLRHALGTEGSNGR
jgi:aminotransferase